MVGSVGIVELWIVVVTVVVTVVVDVVGSDGGC